MIIEKIDSKRVIMALTDEDMQNLSIDLSQNLNVDNFNSKMIVNQIITLANENLGIALKNKKILIEAVPNDNGCVIFISFLPYNYKFRKVYKVKHSSGRIYTFENSEELMSAIKLLYKYVRYIFDSKCYYYNNKYYLILMLTGKVPSNVPYLINEYGSYIGRNSMKIAEIAEHGKLIEIDNAVKKIGAYL